VKEMVGGWDSSALEYNATVNRMIDFVDIWQKSYNIRDPHLPYMDHGCFVYQYNYHHGILHNTFSVYRNG
jgi:hypothetical protein